jgi:hypothetical protein
MGAWGTGGFDNDQAMDLAAEICDGSDGLALIEESLSPNFTEMDVVVATEIVAAAEILAALRGHPAASLPEMVRGWVERNKIATPASLARRADKLLEAVLSEESELAQLWGAGEREESEWRRSVRDLQVRIRAGLSATNR